MGAAGADAALETERLSCLMRQPPTHWLPDNLHKMHAC